MSASNRAGLLNKTFKVLKKHYKPVAPPADRPVLEHLMYACCLQNSPCEQVDEVLAKLQENFFDWNEVRVTTVAELAELMSGLSDANESATRLKRTLHSVFETFYSFDLEFLRKQNLGKSVKDLESFNGTTPFTVSYLTQNALGGHSIPVSRGSLAALQVLGVINDTEVRAWRVPGLERAIPKNKGVEFGSLLHQLGVDFGDAPFAPRVRTILVEIDPEAKERLPKKRTAKKDAKPEQKPKTASSKKKSAPTARSEKPNVVQKADAAAKKKKSSTKRLSRKKPR